MRTNLKEAEPVETDELAAARGDAAAANENKKAAEEALAVARASLEDLERRVKTAPRGDLDGLLRDRLLAREKTEIFEADVAEAARASTEAEERVSKVARERAEAAAAAEAAGTEARIVPATTAVEAAAEAFFKALEARGDAIVATEGAYSKAVAYGHRPWQAPETTREVLARIAARTGIWLEIRLRPR